MKVITMQSKEVVETLYKNNKFTVPDNAPVEEIMVEPYKFMMKHYGYKNRPIFMSAVGHLAEFGGVKAKHSYLIELDIPDRFCKIQDYYGWSDFIYFMNIPWEYKPFKQCNTVEQFGKYILDMYKNGFGNQTSVYQVTTQFLLKSWVKKIEKMNDDFIKNYVDTGGKNILTSMINQ